MKKFIKICLMAAAAMFLIGVAILCICGFAAKSSIRHSIKDTLPSELGRLFDPGHIHPDSGGYDSAYPVYKGKHTDDQAADAEEIQEISLSIGNGICYISASPDNYFHISSSKGSGKFQYYTYGDTFYVYGYIHKTRYNKNNKLYLQIPEIKFDSVTLDLGGGEVQLSQLACHRFDLNVGAAALELDHLSADELTAMVGVGTASLSDTDAKTAVLDIGVGELVYDGSITQDLSADVGMGNLEIHLSGQETSHNYNLSCAMGNISIGSGPSSSFAGLSDHYIDNKAPYTCTLTCAMGNIDLFFDK